MKRASKMVRSDLCFIESSRAIMNYERLRYIDIEIKITQGVPGVNCTIVHLHLLVHATLYRIKNKHRINRLYIESMLKRTRKEISKSPLYFSSRNRHESGISEGKQVGLYLLSDTADKG